MLREEKAQISIELIIVMAALVAMVLLFVKEIQSTSKKGAKVIEEKTKEIFEKIEAIK